MKQPNTKPIRFLAIWGAALALAGSLHAQPAGLWNFDSGDLSATAGQPLTYAGSSAGTSFGTTTSFGIPDIGGAPANVMRFVAGANGGGYRMPVTVAANGGGGLVNDYTVIMDVLYPAGSDGVRRPLVETDLGFFNVTEGAEISINAANGFAVLNNAAGSIAPATWYRLGLVVNGSANRVILYINGQEQGAFAAGGVDGRLALNSSAEVNNYAELFKDLNGATAEGYVNSIQFRGSVLSPGQMLALGAPVAAGIPEVIPPVPPYFRSRTPGPNATGVRPDVTISAVLDQGDRVITPGSVKFLLNGIEVNANIVAAAPTYTISYTAPALLNSGSTQTIGVRYVDNVAGEQTASWSFTVASYQSLSLPTPVHLETFEGLAIGSLPAGWSVTNNTTVQTVGVNYLEPRSDAYLNWVLIDNTITDNWIGIGTAHRYNMPPIAIDGALIPGIVSGKFMYAESDVRTGNQVQTMFTSDYNLTGVNNVFVSFYSMYTQNQDNINALEYSIDGGVTWLPVVYMVNGRSDGPDVLRFPNGDIDAVATLTTARADQAHGLAFGAFIGAEVTQALAPYISGRIDDDSFESKRVEVFRLEAADNQPAVRFRFVQAGTASWYWGIDNFGLYSINTPVITTQPLAQTKGAGESVTFSVVATINPPFTYQWYRNGAPIDGATDVSYTIPSVEPVHAGEYSVLVTNSDGGTPSTTVMLTVVTAPQITSQPQDILVSTGAPVNFTVQALGRQPISYQWYLNDELISGATASSYSILSASPDHAGDYHVTLVNADGEATSDTATLTVFGGDISTDLVLHLKFDDDLTDSSGSGITGTAVGSTPFVAGKIGSSVGLATTVAAGHNYITLGAPTALNFGDSTDFTVSFWISYTQRSSDPSVIGNKNWNSGGNEGWIFAPSSTGLKWNIADSDNVRRDSPGLGSLENGQWHHFLTTFDRGGLAVTYINGVQVNEVDISGMTKSVNTPAGLNVNIGEDGTGNYNTGDRGFTDAKLDDLGIWRRVLTPGEVLAIYQAGQEGKDISEAKVAEGIVAGQWDFNNADLSATVGNAMNYFDGPVGATAQQTEFGTTAFFGIPNIGGEVANVMKFPKNTPSMGFLAPVGGPNGGEGATKKNVHTLIFDILYPAAANNQWRSFIQIDDLFNQNDGDLFVNSGNGIGISGNYPGAILPDTWHRVVFAIDQTPGVEQIRKYIDGVHVGTQNAGSFNGRFGLLSAVIFFTDEDGETQSGYVNSIQVRNEALSDAQVAALGGASASGIPQIIANLDLGEVIMVVEGGSLNLSWTPGAGIRLQRATSLATPVNWQDVPGTEGTGSYQATIGPADEYFRLFRP